jgi:hypothetical protein
MTEEEIMEEKICHGEAAENQFNSINESMLGGNYSLKAKIEPD